MLKGTISDSSRLRKIFKTLQKKYLPITTCTTFQQQQQQQQQKLQKTWQKNGFLSDFIMWAPSTVSLHGKNSLDFRIKFCVSLSIEHIKLQQYNI